MGQRQHSSSGGVQRLYDDKWRLDKVSGKKNAVNRGALNTLRNDKGNRGIRIFEFL